MKVNSYICNKNFEYESEEIMFKEIITHFEQCESDIEIWVIGNIELASTQLDLLVIKRDCLLSIDMKNYKGEIIGNENGDWHVKTEDSKTIKINDNCFQQAQNQRFALARKLENVVKRGDFKKFEDDHRVFINSKAWMYFKEGSTYDHERIDSNALNWFKVITKESLCEEVIKANSSKKYLFNESDINELLSIFQAEPIDKEQENRKQIKEAWLKIQDDPNEAKTIFEKVLGITTKEDLKSMCKHGIASTLKSPVDRLRKLLELYEGQKGYKGYKEHSIFLDIFEAYWKTGRLFEESLNEQMESIYNHLKNIDQIDLIYRIFTAGFFDPADTSVTNFPLQREMAVLLYEYYPDDLKLLELVFHTILRDEESDFGEEEHIGTLSNDDYDERKKTTTPILKKLLEKSDNPEEYIEFYIYGDYPEIGFSEKEFIEILNARIKREPSKASTYYYYLGEYHWHKLGDERKELTDEQKVELANEIERYYLEGLKNDKNDRRCLHALVQWYFSFNKEDTAKEYGDTLIDLEESEVQDFVLLADVLTTIARKQKEKKRDWSVVIKVLEKGVNKFPENGELNSKLGVIYSERGFMDKAIGYFKKTLENLEPNLGVVEFRNGKWTPMKTLRDYEIVALKSLLELYIDREKYREAFELSERLRKLPVSHYEEYTAQAYIKFGNWLVEEYSSHKKGKKEEGEVTEEIDEKKYSLRNFAMSPSLKKDMNYIVHRLKKTKKPHSILLYGPPGTGKTELARNIAGELSFEVMELDSTILSKWVGETEQSIKEFFENARKEGNCVIIIDEFESFGYTRTQHTQMFEHSQSGELLRQIEKTMRSDKSILIIACANYREILDEALIRRGRFNKHIELSYPSSDVRRDIFKIKLEELEDVKLKGLLNYDIFAKETEGLMGADIHYVVFELILKVIFEHGEEDLINDEIVLEAIENFKKEMKKEATTEDSGVPYHQ